MRWWRPVQKLSVWWTLTSVVAGQQKQQRKNRFKTLFPLQSVELGILTLYISNSAAPAQSGRGQAFASCGVLPPEKKTKKHYKISLEISAYIGGIFTVNQFLYDTEIISGSGRASAELRGKSCRCRFYLPALMPGINGLIHQTFNCLGRDLGCRYQLSKCRRGAWRWLNILPL